MSMQPKSYYCEFCGLRCEAKATVTPNQCLNYRKGINPEADWRPVPKKKRVVMKCANCDWYCEFADGVWCSLHEKPAEKKCDEWKTRVEL